MADSDDILIIECSDNVSIQALTSDVSMCQTLQNLLIDCKDNTIYVEQVDSGTMSKIIEYSKYHTKHPYPVNYDLQTSILSEWDRDFIQQINFDKIDLILCAANYLEAKMLTELICKYAIAEHIKNMNTPDMRKVFGITDELTKKEEECIRKENKWYDDK